MNWQSLFMPHGLLSSQAFAPLSMYRSFRAGLPFSMPQQQPIVQYLPPPLPRFDYSYTPPPPPASGLLDPKATTSQTTTYYDGPASKG